MIEVEAPDGTIVEFPDGTPDAVIKDVMRRSFGAPKAVQIDPEREQRINARVDALRAALGEGGVAASAQGGIRGMGANFIDNVGNAILATGEAGVSALTGGEFNPTDRFREMQEAERRYIAGLRENNQGAMAAGEILGGIGLLAKLSGAPSVLAPKATTGAVQSFMAPSSGGLVAQTGKGAAQGAVTGAAYALGDDENPAGAAGVGAAIGGAIPVVGRALGVAGQGVKNAFAPYINPEKFAAGKVVQRLDLDNMTPEQVSRRLARNPGLNVADVAGENTRGLVRTAVNVPGPARTRVIAQTNIRQLGQGDRVGRAIEAAFGDPRTFQSAIDDSVSVIQRQSSPLYQKAFAAKTPVDVSGVVQAIDDRIAPGVNRMVNPKADLADDSVTATIRRVRNYFKTARNQRADLQVLHQVKMDLDDMIGEATRGGRSTTAKALIDVKKELLRAMDTASPDYAQARRIFAGEKEVQDALADGMAYARSPATKSAREIAAMSAAEKEAFRLGVARGLRDLIDSAPDGADVVKRIFGSRSKRAALEPLFENATERAKFQNAMLREARATRTRQAVIGNSTTARQQADMEDTGLAIGTALDAATGGISGAIKSLAARIGTRINGLTPEVADQIGRLTMSRSGADLQRAMVLLTQRGVSMQKARTIIEGLRQVAIAQGGQQFGIAR